MELDRNFSLALIYIGLIILSPFIWKISRAIAHYIFNRYLASEILHISYTSNDNVEFRVTIKTKSDGSVSQKISKARASRHD